MSARIHPLFMPLNECWGNIATKRLFSPESPIWILAEVTLNLSMTLRKKELLFNIELSQLGTQMTRHSVQVSSTASQFSLPGVEQLIRGQWGVGGL